MAKQLQAIVAAAAHMRHDLGSARRRRHHNHLLSPLPPRHPSAVACLLALSLVAATTIALTLSIHPCADPAAAADLRGGGDGRGYAVVINTWKRYTPLRRAIAHYSGCASVEAIHVVWSEPRDPPEALRSSVLNCSRRPRDPASAVAAATEVRFVMNRGNSLNNRFRPIQGLRTDAVFSVDDDLIVPCSTLRFAFSVWRSAPSAMVGFVPRMHWPAIPRRNTKEYRYGSWWSVWRTGRYSMVLSKASFFHKRYLDLYTNNMLPAIRDYVTENRNCEDIAMSFLVANVTGAPPIWVQVYHPNGLSEIIGSLGPYTAIFSSTYNLGRISEMGLSGISSLKGHALQRSRCLETFAAMYGHMPLVATTVKAVDSSTSWFW